MFFILISTVISLAYVCDYPSLPQGSTHYLYKEESLPVVKWLPKSSYCIDKGDPALYTDAGKLKCEYSRGICIWQGEKCVETLRGNDWRQECESLLENNELSMELDNGRIKTQRPEEDIPKVQTSPTEEVQTTLPLPISSASRPFLAPLIFCMLFI